jgi:hypothetical protein
MSNPRRRQRPSEQHELRIYPTYEANVPQGRVAISRWYPVVGARGARVARHAPVSMRWALVEAAVHANRQSTPDVALYRATRSRRDATVARLTVGRKIGKRVYHALRELEPAAA